MSSYVAGALIGGGFVVAGSLLSTWRERHARKMELAAARRAELKLAMREYLAALDAVTLEQSEYPLPPKRNWLDRYLERAAEPIGLNFAAFIFSRLIWRVAYGRRPSELSDRLVLAASHLRLIAPPRVEELMREAREAMRTYKRGDQAWDERWQELRGRMRTEFRVELEALGSK